MYKMKVNFTRAKVAGSVPGSFKFVSSDPKYYLHDDIEVLFKKAAGMFKVKNSIVSAISVYRVEGELL